MSIVAYSQKNWFGYKQVRLNGNDQLLKKYLPFTGNNNHPDSLQILITKLVERHDKIITWNRSSYKEESGYIHESNTFTAVDFQFENVYYTRKGIADNLKSAFNTTKDPITNKQEYLFEMGIEIKEEENKFQVFITNLLNCRLEIDGPLDFLQNITF